MLPSADLVLGLEVGAARAVPALVRARVDVAVVVDALEDSWTLASCSGSVVRMKKSKSTLGGGISSRKRGGVAVAQLARGDALLLGGQRDGLAVLVGSGEQEHLLAALAMWRARTSAAIVVYACPRCGAALT